MKKSLPFIFLALGLFLFFAPSFASGFQTIVGDDRDARLFHYYLENSWQWLTEKKCAGSMLDAAYFHPEATSIGDNDHGLGSSPLYWLFRMIGLAPGAAFVFWALACCVLNFASMYWLLRRELKFGMGSSTLGSWLFAFGAPRAIKFLHSHFLPGFYLIGAVAFSLRFLRPGTPLRKRVLYACLAGACLALQFYSSAYLGWFFILLLLVYGAADLLRKQTRAWIAAQAGSAVLPLSVAFLCFLVLAAPFFSNHALMPHRAWADNLRYFPDLNLWIDAHSYLYLKLDGILKTHFSLNFLSYNNIEQNFGVGLITLLLSLLGLFLSKNCWIKNLFFVFAAVFILLLKYDGFTLWRHVWEWFPGAQNIRAAGRVVFVLLIVYSIGLCAFLKKFSSKIAFAVVAVCMLAENAVFATSEYHYYADMRKSRSIASETAKFGKTIPFVWIPGNAPSLSYNPAVENSLDAMWASLLTGAPTVNGVSQRRDVNLFPVYDQADPLAIESFDLINALDEPYIVVTEEGGKLESRLLQPLPFGRKLEATLRNYAILFSPANMLIIGDAKREEEMSQIAAAFSDISVIKRIMAGNEIALTPQDRAFDFILLLSDQKIADKTAMVAACNRYSLIMNRLKLDFRKIRDFQPLKISGLSGYEPWGRWSDAEEVVFAFPWPLPEKFSLQIQGFAFGPNADREFRLVLGEKNRRFTLAQTPSSVSLALDNPKRLPSFKLIVPQPVSPLELGRGPDARRLGIALTEMLLAD